MRVIHDIGRRPDGVDATALTIGAYDGVHLGHRTVLREVRRRAADLGIQSAVVTFDRHPAEVVRPDSAPRLLTDLDQKLELLESTGIDLAVVIHFDEARAAESAEDFVREVLVDGLGARLVAVGEDFHFGHRRQGDVALLTDLGRRYGFEVLGHHLVGADGRAALDESSVSSTAIRRALVEGRLDDANRMLGRPHEMRGPVVDGDRRGREIGFPTANVAISRRMLYPADGIYAGHLRRADGQCLPSAVYVGHRPTFYDDGAAVVLEVHCLDWSGDLYGEQVAVTFRDRLRGDQQFPSVEALQAQLALDCANAASLLAGVGDP
jgi:riboflavin kinase/FMN adenylyltransferase